jgi:hypothetical protein
MTRPDCFEFAMDFLGEPEAPLVRKYVEELEQQVADLERQVLFLKSVAERFTGGSTLF